MIDHEAKLKAAERVKAAVEEAQRRDNRRPFPFQYRPKVPRQAARHHTAERAKTLERFAASLPKDGAA